MKDFIVYTDGEFLSEENVRNIESALSGFQKTDVPLAVEIAFVDGEEIRRLNRELRQTDRVTDVLSFPSFDGLKDKPIRRKDYVWDLDEEGNLLIGSIAICIERAKEQANEYGHSFERELHYLIIHGVMHCFGFDHEREEDKAEMRLQEEKILGKMGIGR